MTITNAQSTLQPAASPLEAAKEHFVQGNYYFEAGDFTNARVSFETSLTLFPGRASTLGNLGAALVKLGQPEAALVSLDAALLLDPNGLHALSHRGLALADLGRYDEALACHAAVLSVQPENLPAGYQRSLMLKQLGRFKEAVDATQQLLAVDADNVEVWWVRAEAMQRLSQPIAALDAFDQLLRIAPTTHFAWTQKAGLLKDLGRLDEALAAFRQALALGGDAELNGYFIASLSGEQAPNAPPRAYVEHLFDEYADDFDHHLVNILGYRAYQFLIEHLKGIGKPHYSSALDLGCGTGLCGPLLRGNVDRLDGVDLSAQMLSKARELGVYDVLTQADVAEHLQATGQRYDLLVSCDVFVYVGDLEKVFEGAARVLLSGGVFCFSVETIDGSHDFRLLPSQRYAHSERYLRALASSHGFTVVKAIAQPIRQDQQQSIDGLFMYLMKSQELFVQTTVGSSDA